MEKEVAIITLHGMGEYDPNYYVELRNSLLEGLGTQWAKVAFEAVQYQPILQNNQSDIWQRMNKFPLDGAILRRFLLFGFADAGSLEYSARSEINTQYLEVQQQISRALDKAYTALEQQAKPVIIIAQSLGGQVISNYLWDAQLQRGIFAPEHTRNDTASEAQQAFRRLESCTHLLTTGCNIPLFVGGLNPIVAINKPQPEFTWHNYFDKDDVLGWPLSPLSDSYNNLVEDFEINAGGIFTSWTPFSHTRYWQDNQVLEPLITRIRALLA